MPTIRAGKPFNVRRYGSRIYGNQETYYSRNIYRYTDNALIGIWEGYAKSWKEEWSLIKAGHYEVRNGTVHAEIAPGVTL